MDFRIAVRKLELIYNECSLEAEKRKNEESQLDAFSKLRKQLHREIKEVRKMIQERDSLKSNNARENAEASHKIRQKIRDVKGKFAEINDVLKDEEKKLAKLKSGGKSQKIDEIQKEVVMHREVVDLVSKHIEECETLEKRRFLDKMSSSDKTALLSGGTGQTRFTREAPNLDRGPIANALFAGGSKATGDKTGNSDSPLPDIDVDEDLKMLQDRNNLIDQDLDEIGTGVGRVKDLALEMQRELARQNDILTNIDTKADKAQEKLDNINVQMKNSIEKVMKGDRFLMNCILFVILLCIIGFIVSYVVPPSSTS
ncbi:hypothetical protein ROZALSC1DRAFT_29425 [Rozella allomycis CSF55]|uniref:t-SNARE coiled-coil homology domain-containing protein n=1 Tax=Rozella allomycis (strain CSF55) TaxID=988480 RepID=A0A4P9YHX9_ROZAC|nr:hypothetical protein ROZALSC1DRAFT_29425 [Rozella allomycis CSF55]